MANEKKKGGIMEALFGGNGKNGDLYRIIYFTITMYMTDKGPEQFAVLIYGDDQGSIYNNILPAMGILYSYSDGVVYPCIKLTRSFMPGSSKAEIILPRGYSFMSPSMPAVIPAIIEAMPEPVVQQGSVQQSTFNNPTLASDDMITEELIRRATEAEEREKEIQATAMPELIDDEEEIESISLDAEEVTVAEELPVEPAEEKPVQPVVPAPKPKKKHADVIPENDTFGMSFDGDVLSEKISKFMEKRDPLAVLAERPVKEADPRTIEEVKKESVDDNLERILIRDDKMRSVKSDVGDSDATFDD